MREGQEIREGKHCTLVINWTKPEDDPARYARFMEALHEAYAPFIERELAAMEAEEKAAA